MGPESETPEAMNQGVSVNNSGFWALVFLGRMGCPDGRIVVSDL